MIFSLLLKNIYSSMPLSIPFTLPLDNVAPPPHWERVGWNMWCGVAWCGVAWRGVAWCGVVWHMFRGGGGRGHL